MPNLAEILKNNSDQYARRQALKRKAREALAVKEIKMYVDSRLGKLKDERILEPSVRWYAFDVEASVHAYHSGAVCNFEHLIQRDQALFVRLEQEGFIPTIEKWQSVDRDEPGAFVGGWRIKITW